MSQGVYAERFTKLAPERVANWEWFPGSGMFPAFVGMVLEEVRVDYARMRLPHRSELNQPAGVVHGGAIATLIDTAVVPAIGSAFDEPRRLLTVNLQIQYMEPIIDEDAVAEAWVEKRGRSTVFCRVEVRGAKGNLAATGALVYKVGGPR